MTRPPTSTDDRDLVAAIVALHQQAVGRAVAAVNQALVLRNWLIGRHIVTFEQAGKDRAAYGARLLPRLSADLGHQGISGTSRQELGRFRQLFLVYPQRDPAMRPTVSVASPQAPRRTCSTLSGMFGAMTNLKHRILTRPRLMPQRNVSHNDEHPRHIDQHHIDKA